jgi:6-phosphogluconolactonase
VSLPPGERVEQELVAEGLPAPDIVIEPDADRLARSAASALVARLAAAQTVHGTASVVLTGGGIGTAVLRRVAELAAEPEQSVVDWTAVDVWWGDERFVPADDDERNEKGARRALLDAVGVPAARVHAMPSSDGEFAEPEDAAAWYAAQLAEHAGGEGAVPRLDLLLLGMGPEGHVASIFPDSPAARDDRTVVAVRDCPKPPPTRVSLGYAAINSAEEIWLLVSGEGKAEAVARALEGAQPLELPAAGVHGRRATRWLLDAAAAGQLPAAP